MEKNLKKITDHYAAVCLKLKQWCMEIYLNKTGGNTVSSKFLLEARIHSYIWNYHNIVYQLYMKGRKKERKRKVRRRWVEGRKEREEGGRKGGWKTPCRLIAEGMSADCSTPGLPVHQQFPEFTLTHVPSPALNFPSIRVFSNESGLCIRWTKHWSFSFSISPSNEYSGLIFFRMDWLDLLAVQGTLKSLLHHTVQNHQFFSTRLSL